jgi:hypothetical protein
LRVTSYDGDLRVTACTANSKGGRWMGELVEGQPDGEAAVAGQQVRLVHLTNAGSRRTNIGAVNAAGVAIEVAVSLFKGDGSAVGETVLALPPFGHVQENDVFHHLASLSLSAAALDAIDDAYAVVTSSSPGARYFAYASVVDNVSGSPIHIPAR